MNRPVMTSTDNAPLGDDPLTAEVFQELELVRSENEELRALVLELEQALQQASSTPSNWEAQSREFEALLEEKSELIRTLHCRVQELEDAVAAQASCSKPAGLVPREDELMQLSEELERERRQLQEDEEALMQQMRQMEIDMARERAEMGRQRAELQRLQNDLRHELEVAARDNALRERLAPLQRRHQDIINRRGARQ